MGNIYIYTDFEKSTLTLEENNIEPYNNDLCFCFLNNDSVVLFNNFQFGFELKENENIKQYGIFPKPNVKYKQSDQKILEIIRLIAPPNKTYDFSIWVENDGKRVEKTFILNIPQPKQPFDSWVWNEDTCLWDAPIPYPSDNKEYIWNEVQQEWTPTK
jgi:hypothetical protein